MMLWLLIFSCFAHLSFTVGYDFNMTQHENILLSWNNSDGTLSQVLVSQVEIVEKRVLIKKSVFPFSYLVDQNCGITESLNTATIYEANTLKQIKLEYIYMEGQQIMSKNVIEFNTDTVIQLNKDTFLNVSSQPFSSQQNAQSSIESSQDKSVNKNSKDLYMYGEQTLISFDSQLFSQQSSCYMLSPMTTELCMSQQCLTLPPQQVYNMEIGTVIKNYTIVNNQIILPTNDSLNNQTIFINLSLKNTQQTDSLLNLKEQKVNISGHSLIKVNFQLSSLANKSQKKPSSQSSLRQNSPSVGSQNPSQFLVKIISTNSEPVYCIKTIKLFKGGQLIEADKVMFKPFQEISYSLVWQNDQSQIPAVEVFSQNMQLQGRYTMNNYIDFQYNEQKLLMKNSPPLNSIQTDDLQEVTTSESHTDKLPLIIILAASGGTLLIIISGFFFFRKKIFNKCLKEQKQNENEKEKQQSQVKKEVESEKIESAKQLRDDYEFTFQKKQSLFTRTPSTLSKLTQNKTQNPNPQVQDQEQNKNQCSISEQLPQNSPQINSKQIEQPVISQFVPQSKIATPPREDRSLSLTSNYSKSYTKKRLIKRDNTKNKQDEQTQNI